MTLSISMDDTDRPRDPKTMQVLEELSLLKSHLFGAYNIYPFLNPNFANKNYLLLREENSSLVRIYQRKIQRNKETKIFSLHIGFFFV